MAQEGKEALAEALGIEVDPREELARALFGPPGDPSAGDIAKHAAGSFLGSLFARPAESLHQGAAMASGILGSEKARAYFERMAGEAGETFEGMRSPEVHAAGGALDFWASDVASGFGSAASFMAGGIGLKTLAGLPRLAGVGVTGAYEGATRGFYEAKDAGKSDAEAWQAAFGYGLAGTIEMVGIEGRFLAKLDKALGGGLKRAFLRVGVDGIGEATQEVAQGIVENVTAQKVIDENRDIIDSDLFREALVGLIVGGAISSVGEAEAARRQARQRKRDRRELEEHLGEREREAAERPEAAPAEGQEIPPFLQEEGGVEERDVGDRPAEGERTVLVDPETGAEQVFEGDPRFREVGPQAEAKEGPQEAAGAREAEGLPPAAQEPGPGGARTEAQEEGAPGAEALEGQPQRATALVDALSELSRQARAQGAPVEARRAAEERLKAAEDPKAELHAVLGEWEGSEPAAEAQEAPPPAPREETRHLGSGLPSTEIPTALTRAFDAVTDNRTAEGLRTWVQDYFRPVEHWEAGRARETGQESEVTVTFRNWRGKAKHETEQMRRKFVDPIVKTVAANGLAQEEVSGFLRARHALERNAAIRKINPENQAGSGISDVDARKMLARFRKHEKREAFERLGRVFDQMNRSKMEALVEYGLESREDVDLLNEKYAHWAPLRTLDPDEAAFSGIGRGVDIRGKEWKRAFGRTTPSDNPLEFAVLAYTTAIVRGEKNRVGQELLQTLETLPDPDVADINIAPTKREIGPDGLVRERADPTYTLKDNVFAVKRGGKTYHLRFKGEHERIARALKALDVEYGNVVVGGMAKVTRIFARLATQWNPAFAPFNMIRDAGGAALTAGGEHGWKTGGRIVRDIPKAWRGLGQEMLRPGAGKGKWAQYVREWKEDGGQISFLDLNNVQDEIARIRAEVTRNRSSGFESSTAYLRRLGDVLAAYNDIVEQAARVSTYVHMREDHGWSRKRAAAYSKGVTTNFETKGQIGPWLNGLWAFANAGVQGTTRVAQALRSRRLQRAMMGSVLFAAAWQEIARALMGDDEDGASYWDEIPDYIKRDYLVVPDIRKDDGSYFSIPLPFVYRWFNYAGTKTGEAVSGRIGFGEAALEIATGLVEEINPLGGSAHPAQIVAPTVADIPVDVWLNMDWAGRPIAPTKFPGQKRSDASQHWPDTGPEYVALAKWLNEATGGDEVVGGGVDVHPDVIEHIFTSALSGTGATVKRVAGLFGRKQFDEPITRSDIPIVRRFWRAPSPRRFEGRFREWKDDIEILATRERIAVELRDGETMREIRSNPLFGLRGQARLVEKRYRSLRDRWERSSDAEEREKLMENIQALLTDFNARAKKAKEKGAGLARSGG